MDNCIQGQGHNKGSKCYFFSRCCLLNHRTFCHQTLYCDASLWAGLHAKRLVCYFQGQGHSKGSNDPNVIVSTISAELLIILLPNLVWWYIIISQNVLWRNGFVVFKVKVTTDFKMLMNVCPHDIFWIAEPFTTKLGMEMIIMSQIVFQKDWLAVFKVKVTMKDHITRIWLSVFRTADPFATKRGLMAHHHKLDCLVKRLDCSVVVKVKITEKVQNYSECSSGQYLLNCWTFCNQTWYGDALS